jgi:predicted nucleic acid-binding Zn ribbon protein
MLKCIRCERKLKSDSKFCSACGAEAKPAPKCIKCGTEYEEKDRFCSECGSVVGTEASLFGEFIDSRDGTRYRTVKIGTKIWMAENLNYGGKSGNMGKSCDNGYCRVYDWIAAQTACPEGWHLPSFREWYELLSSAGTNSDFHRIFNINKNDHWWSAEEDSPDRSYSWHSSYNNGFFHNNSHKLCLLEVRCVKD